MGLALRRLAKRYSGLDLQVSLEAGDGELVTLLGPSGCGKTTTLSLVAGFLAPDGGAVEIDGHDVTALAPEERGVGIVFQDYALFPHMNVEQNVAFGPRMQGWPREERGARAAELLELVGLAGFAARRVEELSGGEQQRVALARALPPRPRLLLLDEPLSALDRGLRESLRSEIRRVQRELAVTTIYVTHDQEEALALSDRVAVMNGGRVVQEGTPREIYGRPQTRFVALFVGKSNQLDGRLVSREGEELLVETAAGPFRCGGGPGIAAGERVTLLFRPESCRIATGAAAGNRITVTVESVEFLGEASVIRARGPQGRLLARIADGTLPAAGEEVALEVAPAGCWALPAEATEPAEAAESAE